MKPDFADKAAQLYRDQFPRPDNFANAYTTIDAIKTALEDAYRAGTEDGAKEATSVLRFIDESREALIRRYPETPRKELGCSGGACFCTGRCKRTQEEQDAYEKYQAGLQNAFRSKP